MGLFSLVLRWGVHVNPTVVDRDVVEIRCQYGAVPLAGKYRVIPSAPGRYTFPVGIRGSY